MNSAPMSRGRLGEPDELQGAGGLGAHGDRHPALGLVDDRLGHRDPLVEGHGREIAGRAAGQEGRARAVETVLEQKPDVGAQRLLVHRQAVGILEWRRDGHVAALEFAFQFLGAVHGFHPWHCLRVRALSGRILTSPDQYFTISDKSGEGSMAYPDQAAPGRAPIPTFNFLLQPEFPLNALVLASEALRIANQNSGRELFAWRFVSETGGPVRASNGMWLSVDTDFAAMPLADFYLLFEGNLPVQANSPRLLQQLRTATRFGATVGAVDTGAFALAQGGLVDDHAIVLHWEAVPTFRERFPQLSVLNQIYLIDAQRMSCAGGVAILDMMLDLIGRLKTPALANEVANALVYARRAATAPQRSDEWAGRDETTLSNRIVAIMEQNLGFPPEPRGDRQAPRGLVQDDRAGMPAPSRHDAHAALPAPAAPGGAQHALLRRVRHHRGRHGLRLLLPVGLLARLPRPVRPDTARLPRRAPPRAGPGAAPRSAPALPRARGVIPTPPASRPPGALRRAVRG